MQSIASGAVCDKGISRHKGFVQYTSEKKTALPELRDSLSILQISHSLYVAKSGETPDTHRLALLQSVIKKKQVVKLMLSQDNNLTCTCQHTDTKLCVVKHAIHF